MKPSPTARLGGLEVGRAFDTVAPMAERKVQARGRDVPGRLSATVGAVAGARRADVQRVLDRAYHRMATELNCCGCYIGCVTIPVVAAATGFLVVSALV